MSSKTGRALVVVVIRTPMVLIALDWTWLPAPDFVQLDVDARLDMFSHISVRKRATWAKSGLRVKGLSKKFFDQKEVDFQFFLTLYPLNL